MNSPSAGAVARRSIAARNARAVCGARVTGFRAAQRMVMMKQCMLMNRVHVARRQQSLQEPPGPGITPTLDTDRVCVTIIVNASYFII